jgi:DnaK suppressor protein
MINSQTVSNSHVVEESNYISEQMLHFLKESLQKMRQQILQKEEEISLSLINEPIRVADSIDQSANEEQHYEDFRVQEHENQLRHEIELALKKIENGTYGYCEETDDPIGLKRLLALPYARYCVKVQAQKEQALKRLAG